MAVVINSNITGMRAQAHLNRAQSSLANSFERLSSGQRINSADDDAGGIVLASRSTTRPEALPSPNATA